MPLLFTAFGEQMLEVKAAFWIPSFARQNPELPLVQHKLATTAQTVQAEGTSCFLKLDHSAPSIKMCC